VRLLTQREIQMQDLIYIAITVLFFIAAVAYVQFCERMR